MNPRPTMTPARRAWLEQLRDEGPAERPGSNRVGYDCHALGWTNWAYVDCETGQPITGMEARDRYGFRWWGEVKNVGEYITEAGKQALAEAEQKETTT